MYSSPVRVLRITIVAAFAVGCTRDPAPALCPEIATGELVVTEFRGPQTPEDNLGPWVELYNASSSTIDLEGLKVRFRRKDGSDEVPVIVRRSMDVAPGDYVVLGMVNDDATRPEFIDYGFLGDFHQSFLAAAAVDVERCSQLVDRAVYDVLPKVGTRSLGTNPPDANANDIPAEWCEYDMSLGTPQQPNPPCP